MFMTRLAVSALLLCAAPAVLFAQTNENTAASLSIELNTVQNIGGACRLTFLARNGTGTSIDQVVFETVIFDASGGVVNLSLFDFKDLPADRPRVRQFQLPAMTCDSVGKVLINGTNKCTANGSDSDVCDKDLLLRSRLSVELLG